MVLYSFVAIQSVWFCDASYNVVCPAGHSIQPPDVASYLKDPCGHGLHSCKIVSQYTTVGHIGMMTAIPRIENKTALYNFDITASIIITPKVTS